MDFNQIQEKWQKKWAEAKIFEVHEDKDKNKKKFYCLEMFPYPSGSGLHMGHAFNYAIGDIYTRFKRMNNFNVLYPMGYDSFGLPAENAAIKAESHPKIFTEDAIKNFINQQKILGLSYDWNRLIMTHSKEYYKWNQYIFLKFFDKGLIYRKKAPVNYCPECNTVLANEQVHQGKCWRHTETNVEIKQLEQWFIKITDYAEELLQDIPKLEWPERIKIMQENWIGKSHGTIVNFPVKDSSEVIPVFTTRTDTLYGVTFMVFAPEHSMVMDLVNGTKYEEETKKFIAKVVIEDKFTRAAEDKEKEGFFIGKFCLNPLTGDEIPIYIANFVLPDYGTGAVMAVPAHDQRDFEFAKKYNIPIKIVINPDSYDLDVEKMSRAFIEEGSLVNSAQFTGLRNLTAIEQINDYLEEKGFGKRVIQYKLRDWLVSRQRYWGTPIPMVYCENCGIVPVNEKDLPILLPDNVKFGEGNPLTRSPEFTKTKCPKCSADARRETDTMDTFFDSSWYFLRYCSPKSISEPFDKNAVNYWMPVDQYIGGAEHAVMHLIYARFFVKALRDLNYVNFNEPFLKLFNQGMVHGSDGFVMSKSRGNVIDPLEMIKKYGADTLRFYLVSNAAPDKDFLWNDQGIAGSFKFLNKLVRLYEEKHEIKNHNKDKYVLCRINLLIRNIKEHIENFRYNFSVINIIEFVDYMHEVREYTSKEVFKEVLRNLSLILSPFIPHIAEECWEITGEKGFVSVQEFPEHNEKKIDEELIFAEELAGKTRLDIISVLELSRIEKPEKIELFIAEKWKYELFKKVKELNTRNINDIMKNLMDSHLKSHGTEISKMLPKLIDKIPIIILSHESELELFRESKHLYEKEFSCKIEIHEAEDSRENKAKQAVPGKPAIIVR